MPEHNQIYDLCGSERVKLKTSDKKTERHEMAKETEGETKILKNELVYVGLWFQQQSKSMYVSYERGKWAMKGNRHKERGGSRKSMKGTVEQTEQPLSPGLVNILITEPNPESCTKTP